MTRVIVSISAVDTLSVTLGHTIWNKMVKLIVD